MLVRFTSSLMALVISGLVGFWPAGVRAQDEQALLAGFHPYRDGKPQVEGLTPGLQITKDNAQLVEGVLPPELFRVVAAGDFPLTIQETTDFPPTQSYIDASLTYAGQTQIGADGELTNYTAGQPFPHIDPSDPQAGLKIAWNFRYRHFGDTMQNQGTLRSVNSSGNIERAVENAYARMYGMYRPNPDNNVAQWEKEGTWFRDHSIVLSPQDLEGAQQLTFHYAADANAKKAWAYDPRSRRTRSVVVNMLDSSFGLNFMVEDYSGFNGYLSEHDWEYVGEQVALVPGLLQKTPPEFGGKNGWYPLIPWELRKSGHSGRHAQRSRAIPMASAACTSTASSTRRCTPLPMTTTASTSAPCSTPLPTRPSIPITPECRAYRSTSATPGLTTWKTWPASGPARSS